MENKKDNKKEIFFTERILILIAIFIISISLVALIIHSKNNGKGVIFTKNIKVYYRTYTENGGWSSWSKNGKTSGNLKADIKNIEIKVKKKNMGSVVYRITDGKELSEENDINASFKKQDINGLKVGLTDTLKKKYDICYRTYNKKNKWLEWTCNGEYSGNKDENITGVEIKIIPKNSIKYDYLKNYNESNNYPSIGF